MLPPTFPPHKTGQGSGGTHGLGRRWRHLLFINPARHVGKPISDPGPKACPHPQAPRSSCSSGGDQQAGAQRFSIPAPARSPWGWGQCCARNPQALGQGSSDMFPWHLGAGEMSFWAYRQGINKMIFFFSQAPLHKPQGTGLKPGCAHSVMDMHSHGILGRGQSLTPVASTRGASHTQQHFCVIKGPNHAVLNC